MAKVSTKRKRKSLRNRLIYVSVAAVIVLISTLAITRYQPTGKKPANEYFIFSALGAEATGTANPNLIRLKSLFFNITPVEGDATHLNIFGPGMADPVNNADLEISNGTSRYIEIEFPAPYQVTKQGSVYPVTLKFFGEQTEGNVTLAVPEENVGIS